MENLQEFVKVYLLDKSLVNEVNDRTKELKESMENNLDPYIWFVPFFTGMPPGVKKLSHFVGLIELWMRKYNLVEKAKDAYRLDTGYSVDNLITNKEELAFYENMSYNELLEIAVEQEIFTSKHCTKEELIELIIRVKYSGS